MNGPHSKPPLTGIGGLPHDDLDDALRHIREHYDVLFRPQLPIGSGQAGMLAEVLPKALPLASHPGFGVKIEAMIEDGIIAEAFATGQDLEATLLEDQDRFIKAVEREGVDRPLKSQLAGPVTILQSLRDSWSRPLWSEPALHPVVAAWTAGLAGEAARRLRQRHESAMMVLDEPVLGLPGPREAQQAAHAVLRPVIAAIRATGAQVGLHCCSEPPLHLLADLQFDDLLLDLHRFETELIQGRDALLGHLSRDGRLTLGLIPPLPDQRSTSAIPLLDALTRDGGLSRGELVARLALSPCCGTMLAPVAREVEIVAALEAERLQVISWMKEDG